MRVGAWCWQDGGRRLRVIGCLDAHGAALLLDDAARRTPPREIAAGGLALTPGGAAVVRDVLPHTAGWAARRRDVHDVRNAMLILRLRLQLLAGAHPVSGEAVATALHGVDELTAALDRLATPS